MKGVEMKSKCQSVVVVEDSASRTQQWVEFCKRPYQHSGIGASWRFTNDQVRTIISTVLLSPLTILALFLEPLSLYLPRLPPLQEVSLWPLLWALYCSLLLSSSLSSANPGLATLKADYQKIIRVSILLFLTTFINNSSNDLLCKLRVKIATFPRSLYFQALLKRKTLCL